MKKRKTSALILAVGMILSAMSVTVSANFYGTTSVTQIQIYDDSGTLVGTGTFDYDSSYAYGTCQKESGNSYTHAACKLVSYDGNDSIIDSQTGYAVGSASTFVRIGSNCSCVDGIWAIYTPTSSGLIPNSAPRETRTFNM